MFWFKLKLAQKGLIFIGSMLAFELFFLGLLSAQLEKARVERMQAQAAREAIEASDKLTKQLVNAGSMLVQCALSQRNPSAKDNPQARFDELMLDIQEQIKVLRAKVKWNSNQEQAFNYIIADVQQIVKTIQGIKEELDNGSMGTLTYLTIFKQQKDTSKLLERIQDKLHDLLAPELFRAQVSTAKLRKSDQQIRLVTLILVLLNVGGALIAGRLFFKDIVNRLMVLSDNSVRMTKQVALNPRLPGNDEIASVDQVFHQMADTLAELRRKERAVLENASDVICSCDAEGKFLSVNPAATAAWGYDSSELVGESIFNFVNDGDLARSKQELLDHAKSKQTLQIENQIRHKQGNLLDTLWSVNWSVEEQSFILVAHNISQRKEIERLKQAFLAMVSHDLRTPLTNILLLFNLLEQNAYGNLNDKGTERVAAATEHLRRLIRMINDLLNIEMIESGKIELSIRNVSVEKLMERAVDSVEQLAANRDISIVVKESDLLVRADEDRIDQVLVNLLSNAIKFSTDKGKVILCAEAMARSAADGANGSTPNVKVKVIDSGRGVPESMRSAIFDRFKQVEKADHKDKGGFGLGLPICKAFIEHHGGAIGVDSQDGQGSTFWFTLLQAFPETASEKDDEDALD